MNTCTVSRRRPFQLIVDLPELQCEGLPCLLRYPSANFTRSSNPSHSWLRLTASCTDHHTSSTGLLSGDHEGKGCRLTRPFESSTYFFTRLLTWLPSLSTARCNSLWQR